MYKMFYKFDIHYRIIIKQSKFSLKAFHHQSMGLQ